jgi:hypothetical protein
MGRQILGPEVEPLIVSVLIDSFLTVKACLKRLVLRATEQGVQVGGIYDAKDIPNVVVRVDGK